MKNLSEINHVRVVENVKQVFTEIKAYGHEDPRNKLIAEIVLTGGGTQLKHIKQLVEYITGMDTRIGYPNEHLAGDSEEEFSSPLYATAVGLVMNSIDNKTQSAVRKDEIPSPKVASHQPPVDEYQERRQEEAEEVGSRNNTKKEESTGDKIKRSFFDRYVDKIKDFLDNAE